EKKDQENDHPEAPLETSTPSGLTSNQDEPDPLLSNRLRRPNCFDDGHRLGAGHVRREQAIGR
ncbi:MAG: hypothetical protein QF639_08590, partial [Rhodospirillales bacterium]|nr:hypothetical protein [Rhodospirillales bacterium]